MTIAHLLIDLVGPLSIFVHISQATDEDDGHTSYWELHGTLFSGQLLMMCNVANDAMIDGLEYHGENKSFN